MRPRGCPGPAAECRQTASTAAIIDGLADIRPVLPTQAEAEARRLRDVVAVGEIDEVAGQFKETACWQSIERIAVGQSVSTLGKGRTCVAGQLT